CLPLFLLPPPATPQIYTLSLHDALPICSGPRDERGHERRGLGVVERRRRLCHGESPAGPVSCGGRETGLQDDRPRPPGDRGPGRSEEHTSELQSQSNLVCRLLLEKKKEI